MVEKPTKQRWRMLVLICAVIGINYLDRGNLLGSRSVIPARVELATGDDGAVVLRLCVVVGIFPALCRGDAGPNWAAHYDDRCHCRLVLGDLLHGPGVSFE